MPLRLRMALWFRRAIRAPVGHPQWGDSVGGPGFVAAEVGFAVFERGFEGPTGCRSILVNRTTHLDTDSALQGFALGAVLAASPFHASGLGVQFFKKMSGNASFRFLGIGLAPVKLDAKKGAAGSATLTGMKTHF